MSRRVECRESRSHFVKWGSEPAAALQVDLWLETRICFEGEGLFVFFFYSFSLTEKGMMGNSSPAFLEGIICTKCILLWGQSICAS